MPRYFLLTVIYVLCSAPAAQAGIFFQGRSSGHQHGSGHGLWGNHRGHGSKPSCFQASACGPSVCDLNPCERFNESCEELCCEETCGQCEEPIDELTGCECATVEGTSLAEGASPLGGPGGAGAGGAGGLGGFPMLPFGGGSGGAIPGGFGGGFTGGPLIPMGGGFTGSPIVPTGGGLIPGGGIPGGGFSNFGGPTPGPEGGQVPEPSSVLIYAAGTLGLVMMRRRRRR